MKINAPKQQPERIDHVDFGDVVLINQDYHIVLDHHTVRKTSAAASTYTVRLSDGEFYQWDDHTQVTLVNAELTILP